MKNINSKFFEIIFNSYPDFNNSIHHISGGDRILVEMIKAWQLNLKIFIYTCPAGEKFIEKYIPVKKFKIKSSSIPRLAYKNILLLYFLKIIEGVKFYLFNKKNNRIIFSSSDFLPDVLPAVIGKILGKNNVWIAAFYFFAPKPFSKEFAYRGLYQTLRGLSYYFSQQISYSLIVKFADYLILCNEVDKDKFINEGFSSKKISFIYGGVDLSIPDKIKEPTHKIYESAYMARFHPQKGPLIAIKVWQKIIEKFPRAKLCMIGVGSLENTLKEYIKENNLAKNIFMVGFKDGIEKYKLLKSSKIFLHPAVYETGGMAAAEGMAAGLPVVSFKHNGFKYAFPKGMVLVNKIGDINLFAKKVIKLLEDEKEYNQIKKDAILEAKAWDWKKRFEKLESELIKNKIF